MLSISKILLGSWYFFFPLILTLDLDWLEMQPLVVRKLCVTFKGIITSFQADSYEEVYTVSGSSQDQSDSEPEVTAEVVTSPQGRVPDTKNSLPPDVDGGISPTGSLLHRSSRDITPVRNSFHRGSKESTQLGLTGTGHSNSIERQNQTPQLNSSRIPVTLSQRSKTPGPYDLDRENLANRYMITKTAEREVTQRQRLSKTPDRELYNSSYRGNSLSSGKRLSKSCESLDSTGNGTREFGRTGTEGKSKGKLKEHRKKGKRAATVHTLDTDQLLLILNLQMRYLQESREQENAVNGNQATVAAGNRRAITPQPVSQKTVIPQKVRSHTPQPRRANGRIRDPREQSYLQNVNTAPIYRQRLRSDGGSIVSNSANSSRRTSESSDKNFDTMSGLSGKANGEFVYYQSSDVASESYLHAQKMHPTAPNIKGGHNPYIHAQVENGSPENLHYVTYSDSMLNNPPRKPKSRSSVQNYFLPPQPLHRSSHQQLPPQPISRPKNVERQLPPQPVHRGHSAFHVVDRSSQSRSPSVNSDLVKPHAEVAPSRRRTQDYGEAAIRENFSLNSKTVGPTSAPVPGTEHGERASINNPNSNFILRDRDSNQAEILPPYSGPPSYKEYVSSSNTSVTSSLSSNPDDVFGMPRRRISKDAVKLESDCTNSGPSGSHVSQNAGKMYKLKGTNSGAVNFGEYSGSNDPGKNLGNDSSLQRPKGQEVIYSSPAKSKVKQCIVPEDYYTTISKTPRRETTYTNENMKLVLSGHAGDFSSSGSVMYHEPEYGNMANSNLSGYQYKYERSPEGQIGPDAKYSNDYEDVYDSVNLPLSSVGTESFTQFVNSSGRAVKNVKSRTKSPRRQKRANHVSDVFASGGAISSQYKNNVGVNNYGVNSQVTDSVENVHAENVGKIPRIKLNDHVIDRQLSNEMIDDDDVFVEDGSKMCSSGSVHKKFGNQSNTSGASNQNYEEIDEFSAGVGNYAQSQARSDSSGQETETGYMKMTLPGKMPKSENYGIAIHLTGALTNHNGANDHVTTELANRNVPGELANQSTRDVPDGQDNPVDDDSQEYEETGV